MKVLHIINTLSIGGAEKLVAEGIPFYAEYLDKVDLLVLKKTKTTFSYTPPKNGERWLFTTKNLYSPALILKIVPYFKKYDVIHLHLFPALYWGVIAKVISFSKVKLVYTEHSTENRRRNSKVFKILDKLIYSRVNFIGCISKATKDNLIKHLNYKKKNISVIFNGIDLSKFSNENIFNKPAYEFFLEDSFVLIQISSFRKQKDQKTLIESLKFLPEKIKLLLVGDGKLRKEKEEFVKKLGLSKRVKFLGLRNDIPDLIRYADVCVLSSFYEGFGLAVLEGMASYRPSIASNIDGVKEIVDGYGLLFEKGNAKQLSKQILKLYEDNNYYTNVAKKCYERSLDFDIQKMVKNYVNVYEKLVKNI